MRKSVLPGFMFYIGGPQYCDEALLIFNRLTGEQPSTALKQLINEVISYNKEDGTHQLADCYYIRGVHTAELACQNWAKNAHNSTLVNSPLFTPKKGIKGNGSAYINNNYKPFSHSVNYQLSNATIVFMVDELATVDLKTYLGALKTTAPTGQITVQSRLSNNETVRINCYSGANTIVNVSESDVIGYTKVNNSIQGFKNGVVSGSNAYVTTDTQLLDLSIYELCENNNGSGIIRACDGRINFSYYGGVLSSEEHLELCNRVKFFYDNVNSTF